MYFLKNLTHWRFIQSNTLVLLKAFSFPSLSLSPVYIPSLEENEMTQGKPRKRLKRLHISTPFFSAMIWIFIPSIFQPTLDKTNRICVYHICDFLICVCCILLLCSPSACCLFKLRQCSESSTGECWGDGVCLPISPSKIRALLPRKGICPSILLTVPGSIGLEGDFMTTRHYLRCTSIPAWQN